MLYIHIKISYFRDEIKLLVNSLLLKPFATARRGGAVHWSDTDERGVRL